MLFELITPEKVVFKQEIDQVTLPTMDGEITILPNHIALVAQLVPGVATVLASGRGVAVLKAGETSEDVAVSGGFIQVDGKGGIRVLADTAERGEHLNLDDIEAAKKRAEDVMKSTVRTDDQSFARAAAELEREMARYKVALKYKSDKTHKTRIADKELTDEAGTV